MSNWWLTWYLTSDFLPKADRVVLGWYPDCDWRPGVVYAVCRVEFDGRSDEGQSGNLHINMRDIKNPTGAPLYWQELPTGPGGEDPYASWDQQTAHYEMRVSKQKYESDLVAAIMGSDGVEKRDFRIQQVCPMEYQGIDTVCLSFHDYTDLRKYRRDCLHDVNDNEGDRGKLFETSVLVSGQVPSGTMWCVLK